MDRTRLGLTAFLRPEMDVEDWIDLAHELGLGWLELRADPGLAHPEDLTPQERRRLKEHLREAGLRASLHAPIHGMNLVSPNLRLAAAALAEHVGTIELAPELGAKLVVFHPGGLPGEYARLPGAYERAWQRLGFVLDILVPTAVSRGVRLAIENKQAGAGRDLILTPEEHLRALEGRPELGACLDFGHLNTVEGDPAAFVRALGERLVHVHLHDNQGERDEHLGLGQGTVPWEAALRALGQVGYQGAVILEIPDPDQARDSVARVCSFRPPGGGGDAGNAVA